MYIPYHAITITITIPLTYHHHTITIPPRGGHSTVSSVRPEHSACRKFPKGLVL